MLPAAQPATARVGIFGVHNVPLGGVIHLLDPKEISVLGELRPCGPQKTGILRRKLRSSLRQVIVGGQF